jgi:hypothetical protein
VIASLVATDPANARAIAEGALLRLTCGARSYERYRKELRVADRTGRRRRPLAAAAAAASPA